MKHPDSVSLYYSLDQRRRFRDKRRRQGKGDLENTDGAWFAGGPDDPNGRVLRIEPITAELWDGPSSAAAAVFEFARSDKNLMRTTLALLVSWRFG